MWVESSSEDWFVDRSGSLSEESRSEEVHLLGKVKYKKFSMQEPFLDVMSGNNDDCNLFFGGS